MRIGIWHLNKRKRRKNLAWETMLQHQINIKMLLFTWILSVNKGFKNKDRNIISLLEPVKLIGEGEYNLNSLMEITVTESYLGLHPEDRKCQNDDPLNNCTTRQYHITFLGKCGCLPFNLRPFQKVHLSIMYKDGICSYIDI